MLTRKFAAIAAVLVPLGVAAPVASASAATAAPAAAGPTVTFVPPKVGPLQVSLGPTIIQGKVISPGVDPPK